MGRKKKTPTKPPRKASPAVDLSKTRSPNEQTRSGSKEGGALSPPDSSTVQANQDEPPRASTDIEGTMDGKISSESQLHKTSVTPPETATATATSGSEAITGTEAEQGRPQPMVQPPAIATSTQKSGSPESHNPPTGSQNNISVAGNGKLQMASAGKKTWAECVTGKTGSLQKRGDYYKLDSGATCVTIPNGVISRNKKAWSTFVLGHFHGTLPSMGALHAILNGIWSNKNRDISISRVGEQSILIKIPSSITRKRVLAQGIWHIEGQSMFVGEWEPGLQPEIPELKEVPVWVDFRGVPPHFFSTEGLEYIAGMVGQPLQLHPRTAAMINLEVAKVFMMVDLRESLPESVFVRFESGETLQIYVSCQWLPPLCTHCQQYGHSLRRCPKAPITCRTCKSTTHEDSECTRVKRKNNNPTARRRSPKPTYRRRDHHEDGETTQNLSSQANAVTQGTESQLGKDVPATVPEVQPEATEETAPDKA